MQNLPDKSQLRRALLAQRQQLPGEVRRTLDAALQTHVFAWWKHVRPRCLAVYVPMRGEPDLLPLYRRIADEGGLLALPRVAIRDAPLEFAQWHPDDPLGKDLLGVPAPYPEAARVQPDALLIPCVGFNARRQRLGYGGGYYDRTLAVAARPITIGIAYACCRCVFDGGPHDIELDQIITEEG